MGVEYSQLLVGAGVNAQNSLTPSSSTHPPTVDAVVEELNDRPTQDDLTQLRLDLGTQIAQKQDPLSVAGLATLEDGVLTINAPEVTGQLIDGSSWLLLPGLNGFDVLGARGGSVTTVGTVTTVGPANPTNGWLARTRAVVTGSAGQANMSRVVLPLKVRAPENNTSLYGGYHKVFTFATGDGISGRTAVGVFQVVPSLGVDPAAYTGARFMIANNLGDTTLKVYAGGTLVQDLGASFPANSTDAFEVEFWSKAYPNFGFYWRITNLMTLTTVSGTQTSNIPVGDHDPYFVLLRDSGASTSATRLATSGAGGGAYVAQIMGEAADDVSPVFITENTVLTKAAHAYRNLYINSATPVTLTIAGTGWSIGDDLRGANIGSAAATIVDGSGTTIQQHDNVTATIEPKAGFGLTKPSTYWLRMG
jgi:hypothetical protein